MDLEEAYRYTDESLLCQDQMSFIEAITGHSECNVSDVLPPQHISGLDALPNSNHQLELRGSPCSDSAYFESIFEPTNDLDQFSTAEQTSYQIYGHSSTPEFNQGQPQYHALDQHQQQQQQHNQQHQQHQQFSGAEIKQEFSYQSVPDSSCADSTMQAKVINTPNHFNPYSEIVDLNI